jgi:hypothetical protein
MASIHSRAQRWTEDEDMLLKQLITQFGRQWSVIASQIPNRTATQVASRWEKCINPTLTKGQFTSQEDQIIIDFVNEHGTTEWPKLVTLLPHRTPKQCRERWFNSLDPTVVKGPWTAEEDRSIFEGYVTHGPKWALIAQSIAGRSDNAIKNRWNASISKRMQISESGQPELGPNKTRKYSRRKAVLPPPLMTAVARDPVRESEADMDTLSLMQMEVTPRSRGFDGFGTNLFDFDSLGMNSLEWNTPLQSPVLSGGVSLFTPTGTGFEF